MLKMQTKRKQTKTFRVFPAPKRTYPTEWAVWGTNVRIFHLSLNSSQRNCWNISVILISQGTEYQVGLQSQMGPLVAKFEMTTIFGGNGEVQEKSLTFFSLRYFVTQKIFPRNTPEFQDEDDIFSKIQSPVTTLKTVNGDFWGQNCPVKCCRVRIQQSWCKFCYTRTFTTLKDRMCWND